MTAEQIEMYLEILLNVQKEQYMQRQLMNRLTKERDSLGKKRRIIPPEKQTVKGDYKDTMLGVGAAGGIIIAIIVAIISVIGMWKRNMIIAVIGGCIIGLAAGIVGGLVLGLFVGPIVAAVSQSKGQKNADDQYYNALRLYDQQVEQDNKRMHIELQMKQKISSEINLLFQQIQKTNAYENQLTNLGILDSVYFHDMVATASFYQYFKSKMTYSLGFNPTTGDQGAYNIYEQEKRMNIIIYKLDVVIAKLDQIQRNQGALWACLNEANRKMNTINNNILKSSKEINANINRQTEIQQYSNECTQAQLDYTNTLLSLNIMRYY